MYVFKHVKEMATGELRRRRNWARDGGLLDSTSQSTRVLRTKASGNGSTRALEVILKNLPLLFILLHLFLLLLILFWTVEDSESERKDLSRLIRAIEVVLRKESITVWISPGASLLPSKRGKRVVKLTKYHRWLTFGIMHGDELGVIGALSRNSQLVAVETHGGLRVFFDSQSHTFKHTLNYREPYVDLIYFREDGRLLVSECCGCDPKPPPIEACTKKMCRCRACVALKDTLYPLEAVRLGGTVILAPKHIESILVDFSWDDIHPHARAQLTMDMET